LAGIPSAPVSFLMLILFIIFSTLSVVTFSKTNLNDPLLKTNYRPVSVLCIFSKIFEKILEQQLSDFFENIFNPYLCAFRRCAVFKIGSFLLYKGVTCAFFNLSGKTLLIY
jgi:hypothetical protein